MNPFLAWSRIVCMAEGARVDSLDVLKDFKAVLWKFQEAAIIALGDAESEVQRTLTWLETEQDSYWQGQVRKCQELVVRAKEAVRMKKVFKDSTGRQQSAVDEEKALQLAVRRLAEAEQKLASTRRWARLLQKEIELYKGGVQRFATTVQSEIPAAAAHLEKLAAKLDAYVALRPEGFGGGVGVSEPSAGGAAVGSMARGAEPAQTVDIPRLEQHLPTAQQREAAPLIAEIQLSIPAIPDAHQAGIASLRITDLPAAADARVILDPGIDRASNLVLHRVQPASSDDSGWTIALLESNAGASWQSVRIAALLRARPDLRDLLTLPQGFSVIIDGSGIVEVVNAERQAVWRREQHG